MSEPEDDCCHDCHFRWEEDTLHEYLPPALYAWMLSEHVRLRRLGLPAEQVEEHATYEEAAFEQYLPPELFAKLVSDHDKLAAQ